VPCASARCSAVSEPSQVLAASAVSRAHQGVEDTRLSGEDLDAHLAAPHLVEFANKMRDPLDESGLTVNRVRRIV
jgi:hypothetical protein